MNYLSLFSRTGFLYALLIVVAASFVGATFASDSRPIEIVQEAERAIQANQSRIAELRPLVEEFEALKSDNSYNVGRIEAHGYTFDWNTLKAKKVESFQKEESFQ